MTERGTEVSPFDRWMASLETRHLADLRFADVTRALRALSSAYVERRHRVGDGAALAGAGKRAAFALFYAPLHYLVVRDIVRSLPGATRISSPITDLGCGTGAGSAAWAEACERRSAVIGIDRHPWSLDEARQTYREFGLTSRVRMENIATATLPKGPQAFLAAYAINELADSSRDQVMAKLIHRAANGDRLLIVEPMARFVTPWWKQWTAEIERVGGRADEWRFRIELPPIVKKLDSAAGLDHRELTARSLSVGL